MVEIYGTDINLPLLAAIGSVPRRVLDVGAGTGAWADELRRRGATELVAVDASSAACRLAQERYDRVVCSSVESVSFEALGGRPFELIVAADILEHLIDPWAALRQFREWAAPGAILAISTPNLRYYRLLRDLVIRGKFEYGDEGGLMDRTHLRWFTRRSLDQALRESGWRVLGFPGASGARRERFARLTGHRLDDFLWHQLQAIATPAAKP